MRRSIWMAVAAATFLGLAPHAFAAGWALTLDTPLSYTFNDASATTPSPGGAPANWHNRTTTEVSGSKVLLIAPFHVGIGYEDYSVAQSFDFVAGGNNAPAVGKAVTNLRIYDLVVDVPMKYLNVTLGYGSGTADTDLFQTAGPGTGGQNPTPIRNANVTQTFLVLGIPLGSRLDIHVGYHWIKIQEQDIVHPGPGAQGTPDQTALSGEMLSAGLRLNF
jgi:hypothetical protein